ncbi:hypothetical protein [Glutamicibacter sp. AOP5-A2-18]|uniref:hypothetical protein n=1 Tax=Glutamicibacter sp. AOP5-A2-18 TaxID=3457656 RepID=UPI0040348155
MSPDKRQRKPSKQSRLPLKATSQAKRAPSSDDVHSLVYFKRHKDGDPNQPSPGRDFLKSCPPKVRATMRAVLIAVAEAPPKSFSGGGYWEAMHGDMSGWFEIRVDGPKKKEHFRLFCRLDYEAEGLDKPLLVIIDGRSKPTRTTLSDEDYAAVRKLGDEYFSRNPRPLA